MNYNINLGAWKSVFAVPSNVVDEYILLAGSASLKVLLYLLRHSGEDLSCDNIKSALKLSSDDVGDSLLFWEQAGLIKVNAGNIAPAQEASAKDASPTKKKAEVTQAVISNSADNKDRSEEDGVHVVMSKVKEIKPGKSNRLSAGEIASRINESAEIAYLFQSAEQRFKRPLNHTEQRSLISMHDYIGLSVDVILIIIEYCQSIDRCNVRYIETIAANWADRGITTHAQAEEAIVELKQRFSYEKQIKHKFGIERALIPKEKEFAFRWMGELGMSIDMVDIAFQRAVENTGKCSFAYINTIIESWSKKGITTPNQAMEEKESFKKKTKKKEKKKATSYNLDDFDRIALQNTPK